MSLIYMTPAAETAAVSVRTSTEASPRRRRNCLYLGAKADAKSRDKLQRWGITHILNATPSKDASIQAGVPNYFEKSGCFVYKRIPVYDAATSNFLEFADDIVNFIATGLCHGSVLVHCQRGVSRSATCALMYLMSKASMKLDQALTLVRRRRPGVEPIPAFIAQLRSYEERCRSLGLLKDEDESKETSQNNAEIDNNEEVEPKKDCGDTRVNQDKKDDQVEPSAAKRVMGPSLPPNISSAPSAKRPVIGRTMGPSLPPNISSAPSAKRPMIGPTIPPPSGAKKANIGPQREH